MGRLGIDYENNGELKKEINSLSTVHTLHETQKTTDILIHMFTVYEKFFQVIIQYPLFYRKQVRT
jgi:hypothetical protein